MIFTTALFIATAVLALWLDSRMPRLAPSRTIWRAVCVVVFVLVCGYVPVATGSYIALYGTVFGLLTPMLVGMWLSALWLLRSAAEALDR